jgi:hypothetical protein
MGGSGLETKRMDGAGIWLFAVGSTGIGRHSRGVLRAHDRSLVGLNSTLKLENSKR